METASPAAFPRVDRTVVTRCTLAAADDDLKAYWWSRTPPERWAHMEQLRRLNDGDAATGRLQLVLEVVKQPWG